MIKLVKRYRVLADGYAWNLVMDECNKTMAFAHGDLLFVFNWHPQRRFPTTSCPCRRPANTCPALDRRAAFRRARAAGDGRRALLVPAQDGDNTERPHIRIYNTSRTATVYLRTDGRQPSAVTGSERSGERTRPGSTARRGSKRPGGNRNGTAMENPIAVKGNAEKTRLESKSTERKQGRKSRGGTGLEDRKKTITINGREYPCR